MNVDLNLRIKAQRSVWYWPLFMVGSYLVPIALIAYVFSMAWSTGITLVRVSSILILSLALGLKIMGDFIKYSGGNR